MKRALANRTNRVEPIFIVGVPRSGTTLLAGMLCGHGRLSCGPETHFFNALTAKKPSRLVRDAQWPREAVGFLGSIMHAGRPVPTNYDLDGYSLEEFMVGRPRALRTILEALTESYMMRVGKTRWVEKTPDHIACVATIRRNFPASPIIRIIRDPRDVALSILGVPWGPDTFLGALLLWRYYDDRSRRFFEMDRHSHTIRYEDLLREPEKRLREICAFIGEDYEPGMLDPSRSVAHVNKTNEPWKDKVGYGLDTSRVGAWQGSLTEEQNRLAEALMGDRLTAHGYPNACEFSAYLDVRPVHALARYPGVMDLLYDGATRFWPACEGEVPGARYLLGEPDADRWFSPGSAARLSELISLASDVAKARLSGVSVRWLCAPPGHWRNGRCARLFSRLVTDQQVVKPATSVGGC